MVLVSYMNAYWPQLMRYDQFSILTQQQQEKVILNGVDFQIWFIIGNISVLRSPEFGKMIFTNGWGHLWNSELKNNRIPLLASLLQWRRCNAVSKSERLCFAFLPLLPTRISQNTNRATKMAIYFLFLLQRYRKNKWI